MPWRGIGLPGVSEPETYFFAWEISVRKEKKNRQKSLNSKVEEMQKRSSKIPEEFNMQEGALMPGGRNSLNWPRGEARPSGFRSFRYTKALGFH